MIQCITQQQTGVNEPLSKRIVLTTSWSLPLICAGFTCWKYCMCVIDFYFLATKCRWFALPVICCIQCILFSMLVKRIVLNFHACGSFCLNIEQEDLHLIVPSVSSLQYNSLKAIPYVRFIRLADVIDRSVTMSGVYPILTTVCINSSNVAFRFFPQQSKVYL